MKVFYLILLFAGAVANAYAQEQIQASRIYKANIFETIKREASFSVLRRKLQEAGADGIFLSFDRFTLFAPINDAFDASPYDVDMLRSKRGMQFILEKHIISRSVDLDRKFRAK